MKNLKESAGLKSHRLQVQVHLKIYYFNFKIYFMAQKDL